MNSSRSARRARQRGNAMVEFGLAMALLIPIMFGVFQFGYGFYHYNRLVGAVREGARYASLRTYDSASTTPSNGYLTAVKNTVVYGSPSGGTTPVVPGLSTGAVNVSVTMPAGVPDMIAVRVSSFSVDTIFKTLTWQNKPEASFRFEGTFTPPN